MAASTTSKFLPITETITPTDQAEAAAALRAAFAARKAVYPLGGETSLDFGLPAKQPGTGLSLAKLDRIVDYPSRDMTITIEAGITIERLSATLAAEGQRLPIDAPQAAAATLGGVVATNTSGPRRYGHGTVRDYVIGIGAIDGRGIQFKGGGRVVKNVAGYDFCKLLTGSLGTLGVIAQITLKVKPLPERSVLLACDVATFAQGEVLLAALVNSQTTPCAIELLTGSAWEEPLAVRSPGSAARLVVGLEGTAPEMQWMIGQLSDEWQALGVREIDTLDGTAATAAWSALVEFPAQGDAPLVVKASVRPSAVTGFCELLRSIAGDCSIQAHAGSGVLIARFPQLPDDYVKSLVSIIHPAASAADGSAIVLHAASPGDLTRQATWGNRDEAVGVMDSVKRQFDPANLLNPGRFVY